jgi:hypothetical protein
MLLVEVFPEDAYEDCGVGYRSDVWEGVGTEEGQNLGANVISNVFGYVVSSYEVRHSSLAAKTVIKELS